MGDIRRPYDFGSRDQYPSVLIQCFNGRDTMVHELWSHVLDGISHDVHPTAWVEIPTGNVGEFVTEYQTTGGWRNRIIGNFLSMRAFNSLKFLEFGVVVFRIFTMLLFQMQPEGGIGLEQLDTVLIILIMVYDIVPSMPVLLTLRGVLFCPMLYKALSSTNYCIAGVLSTYGACTTPVLMVKFGWLFTPILGSIGGSNTGTPSCLIQYSGCSIKFGDKFCMDCLQIILVCHSHSLWLNNLQRFLLSSFRLCRSDCFRSCLLSN